MVRNYDWTIYGADTGYSLVVDTPPQTFHFDESGPQATPDPTQEPKPKPLPMPTTPALW